MTRFSLVVSDVDGTLVTPDKSLTPRAIDAVRRLHENGVAFSICSSRPPFGMRMLVDPLQLRLPFGGYNGGLIVEPDLSPVEAKLIPPDAAARGDSAPRSKRRHQHLGLFRQRVAGPRSGRRLCRSRNPHDPDPADTRPVLRRAARRRLQDRRSEQGPRPDRGLRACRQCGSQGPGDGGALATLLLRRDATRHRQG